MAKYKIKGKKVTGTNKKDKITWVNSKAWKKALTVNAGKGDDIINFKKSKYKNTLNGQDGKDIIYGGKNNDTITGGKGSDTIYTGKGTNTVIINKGDGNDTIYHQGTKTNLQVKGAKASDIQKYTKSGNDLILTYTHAGTKVSEVITLKNYYTGNKNIYLKSTTTQKLETLMNAKGMTITGSGNITGTNGNDVINAGNGNDQIYGGAGADIITAGTGNDSIDGGDGNDTIIGTSGKNTLLGGAGDDSITGGTDNDTITGGDGNDTINAVSGNNTINAGAGNDIINAGTGVDTFVFASGDGNDTINNATSLDKIEFTGTVDEIYYGFDATKQHLEIYRKTGDKTDKVTISDYANSEDRIDTIVYNGVEKSIKDDAVIETTASGEYYGTILNDKIITSPDSDEIINAGRGNNTIIITGGDDVINAGGGNDTLEFTGLTDFSQLTGDYDGNNFKLTYSGGTVTLQDYVNGNHSVSAIKIGDTTKSMIDYVTDLDLPTLIGTAGDEELIATANTREIIAGKGDDTIDLTNSTGVTVHIKTGDGIDTIKNLKSNDILSFEDSSSVEPIYNPETKNLELSFGNEDKIVIENYPNTSEDGKIKFADSEAQTISEYLESIGVYIGTDGVDSISGKTGIIYGLDGDDNITAGADGKTTIVGGKGGDTLQRSADSTNQIYYQFDINGAGNDTIIDGLTGYSYIKFTGTDDATEYSNFINSIEYEMSGNDLVIKYGENNANSITIQGYDISDNLSNLYIYNSINGTDSTDNLTGCNKVKTVINGNGGDDVLKGGLKDTTIYGGEGNDIITGGKGGYDELYGNRGNDEITAGSASYTTINGGAGDDILKSGETVNITYEFSSTGDGNDTIIGRGSYNYIKFTDLTSENEDEFYNNLQFEQTGNDLVIKYAQNSSIKVQDYFIDSENLYFKKINNGVFVLDYIRSNGLTIIGTENSDTIQGDRYTKEIFGLGGDDEIVSGHTNTTINGGAGNDVITGDGKSGETQILNGDEGDDTITADYSAIINGGEGNDNITSGTRINETYILNGDAGDDTITANAYGTTIINGGAGNDTLIGERRNSYQISETLSRTYQFNKNGDGHDQIIDDYSKDKYIEFTGIETEADKTEFLNNLQITSTIKGLTLTYGTDSSVSIRDYIDNKNYWRYKIGNTTGYIKDLVSEKVTDTYFAYTGDADAEQIQGYNYVIGGKNTDIITTNPDSSVTVYAGKGRNTIHSYGNDTIGVQKDSETVVLFKGDNKTTTIKIESGTDSKMDLSKQDLDFSNITFDFVDINNSTYENYGVMVSKGFYTDDPWMVGDQSDPNLYLVTRDYATTVQLRGIFYSGIDNIEYTDAYDRALNFNITSQDNQIINFDNLWNYVNLGVKENQSTLHKYSQAGAYGNYIGSFLNTKGYSDVVIDGTDEDDTYKLSVKMKGKDIVNDFGGNDSLVIGCEDIYTSGNKDSYKTDFDTFFHVESKNGQYVIGDDLYFINDIANMSTRFNTEAAQYIRINNYFGEGKIENIRDYNGATLNSAKFNDIFTKVKFWLAEHNWSSTQRAMDNMTADEWSEFKALYHAEGKNYSAAWTDKTIYGNRENITTEADNSTIVYPGAGTSTVNSYGNDTVYVDKEGNNTINLYTANSTKSVVVENGSIATINGTMNLTPQNESTNPLVINFSDQDFANGDVMVYHDSNGEDGLHFVTRHNGLDVEVTGIYDGSDTNYLLETDGKLPFAKFAITDKNGNGATIQELTNYWDMANHSNGFYSGYSAIVDTQGGSQDWFIDGTANADEYETIISSNSKIDIYDIGEDDTLSFGNSFQNNSNSIQGSAGYSVFFDVNITRNGDNTLASSTFGEDLYFSGKMSTLFDTNSANDAYTCVHNYFDGNIQGAGCIESITDEDNNTIDFAKLTALKGEVASWIAGNTTDCYSVSDVIAKGNSDLTNTLMAVFTDYQTFV